MKYKNLINLSTAPHQWTLCMASCVIVCTISFYVRGCKPYPQPPTCRTSCVLSAVSSICFLQTVFLSEAWGCAMLWWQGKSIRGEVHLIIFKYQIATTQKIYQWCSKKYLLFPKSYEVRKCFVWAEWQTFGHESKWCLWSLLKALSLA